MRHRLGLAAILLLASTGLAPAQDATVIGSGTVLPGSGPGTTTGGSGGGMTTAPNAEDAARRQNTKPSVFLAHAVIGIPVRNTAGESVGKIEDLLIADGGTLRAVIIDVSGILFGKRIAVDPSAIVLRPGGERYSAVIALSKDVITGAQPFDPAKAGLAP